MTKPDFSLVIPVFNERENLPPLLKNIREAMSAVSDNYEIIFVDDGSRDGSNLVLRKIKRESTTWQSDIKLRGSITRR